MGKPGVFVNCDTFNYDAVSAASDHSMPAFRHRQIKSSEFYKMRGEIETIRPLVEAVFDDLIDALTTPLTPEETDIPQPEMNNPATNSGRDNAPVDTGYSGSPRWQSLRSKRRATCSS